MRAFCGACLLAAAWGLAGAQDLYRADQPEVLQRPPAAADGAVAGAGAQAIVAKFAQAYAAAGRPRVLVLWHRDIGDKLTDAQQLERNTVSAGRLAQDNFAQQVVVRWKDRPSQPASLLPPARAADYEAGLSQTLLQAGVRLVDRSMALRMTALKSAEAGKPAAALDVPTVEAESFASLADQVLQVQLLPDPANANGWSSRLTLVEVRTGLLLADSVAASAGAPGRAGASDGAERVWLATDKGFVAGRKPLALGQLAARDAVALMKALAP